MEQTFVPGTDNSMNVGLILRRTFQLVRMIPFPARAHRLVSKCRAVRWPSGGIFFHHAVNKVLGKIFDEFFFSFHVDFLQPIKCARHSIKAAIAVPVVRPLAIAVKLRPQHIRARKVVSAALFLAL